MGEPSSPPCEGSILRLNDQPQIVSRPITGIESVSSVDSGTATPVSIMRPERRLRRVIAARMRAPDENRTRVILIDNQAPSPDGSKGIGGLAGTRTLISAVQAQRLSF